MAQAENIVEARKQAAAVGAHGITLVADTPAGCAQHFLTDAQYLDYARAFKKSFDARENVNDPLFKDAIKAGKIAPGDEIPAFNYVLQEHGFSGSYQNWTDQDYAHLLKTDPNGYYTLMDMVDAARCGVVGAREGMAYLSPNGNWKSYHNTLITYDIEIRPSESARQRGQVNGSEAFSMAQFCIA